MNLYYDRQFNGRTYQMPNIFPKKGADNFLISFNAPGNAKPFHCLTVSNVVDLHLTGDSQCLPLYRYNDMGNRIDNITDWALRQFREQYTQSPVSNLPVSNLPISNLPISKLNIFHYVYAVLHHPAYREKYELNLKREFPRIPFYDNFWQWATWGEQLMHLHLTYETIDPFPLTRTDLDPDTTRKAYKAYLRRGGSRTAPTDTIELDTLTTLSGIPAAAWEYKLGNRSALEWILDRYKERKPKDPTIREQFNTYRFANYKEHVIDLLTRVCTVSVETMKIINQMPPTIPPVPSIPPIPPIPPVPPVR